LDSLLESASLLDVIQTKKREALSTTMGLFVIEKTPHHIDVMGVFCSDSKLMVSLREQL
jgi:hypothetical protein